ncbi:MAG: LysR family transcriptional regulator [Cyclobacteriaceae bacterium]
MTLNQLEYALCLKETGNFKKAADRMSITQPGLSAQIKKLEEEIGIKLFSRNSHPIEVTADGQKFLHRAHQILTDARKLTHFSQELTESFEGDLKVGVIPTLAPFLIPLFSGELLEDYPHFQLDIHELTTDQVISGVRAGTLDAGIISTPISTPGLVNEVLFFEKFYAYVSDALSSKKYFSMDDINYDQFWILNEGNCFRDQLNDFCDLSRIKGDRQFNYRSNSIDALVRIVDSKGGMTILPELSLLSLNEEQEERILPLLEGKKVREISLVMTKQFDKERFILKLAEYIKKNVPKHMLQAGDSEIVDPQIKD